MNGKQNNYMKGADTYHFICHTLKPYSYLFLFLNPHCISLIASDCLTCSSALSAIYLFPYHIFILPLLCQCYIVALTPIMKLLNFTSTYPHSIASFSCHFSNIVKYLLCFTSIHIASILLP